jgi:hypothetical protein
MTHLEKLAKNKLLAENIDTELSKIKSHFDKYAKDSLFWELRVNEDCLRVKVMSMKAHEIEVFKIKSEQDIHEALNMLEHHLFY